MTYHVRGLYLSYFVLWVSENWNLTLEVSSSRKRVMYLGSYLVLYSHRCILMFRRKLCSIFRLEIKMKSTSKFVKNVGKFDILYIHVYVWCRLVNATFRRLLVRTSRHPCMYIYIYLRHLSATRFHHKIYIYILMMILINCYTVF
jgi:hypothetical protein